MRSFLFCVVCGVAVGNLGLTDLYGYTVEYWSGNEASPLAPLGSGPPGGVSVYSLGSVPLVQTDASVLQLGGSYYPLYEEGLYRVYDDESNSVRQTVQYFGDIWQFAGHISRMSVHSTRHDGMGNAAWNQFAWEGIPVATTCGNTVSFALPHMAAQGIQARRVQTVAKSDWNYYDDGHQLMEIFDPDRSRWILFDVDLGHRFGDSGRYLSNLEVTQIYRRDDGSRADTINRLNANSKVDPELDYVAWLSPYVENPEEAAEAVIRLLENDDEETHIWAGHAMEIPMMNNAHIATESQVEIDLIRTLWPNITALSFAQYFRTFYPGETMAGDLNDDLFVGAADLDIVRAHWGQTVVPGDLLSGDISGNGFVGGGDLDTVRAYWGSGYAPPPTASPAPVCEPSTLMLLVLGTAVVAVLQRARRRWL